jgi:hypothetical protein
MPEALNRSQDWTMSDGSPAAIAACTLVRPPCGMLAISTVTSGCSEAYFCGAIPNAFRSSPVEAIHQRTFVLAPALAGAAAAGPAAVAAAVAAGAAAGLVAAAGVGAAGVCVGTAAGRVPSGRGSAAGLVGSAGLAGAAVGGAAWPHAATSSPAPVASAPPRSARRLIRIRDTTTPSSVVSRRPVRPG